MRADAGVGATIDGFRIEVVITQDSSGTLFRAHDEQHGRPAAMFVLAPKLAEDQAVRSRFVNAAELATTLRHPHALPVEAFGDTEDAVFVVSPWFDGVDLAARLASRGPLSPAATLRVLIPVARALAAAHRLGLAHGSLTPEHVLIADGPDGEVYLGGFGIGQARRGPATLDGDISAFGALLLQTLGYGTPGLDHGVGAGDGGLGDRLETIAADAQASDPDRTIDSADELVLALEHARAAARAATLAPDRRRTQDEPTAVAAGASSDERSQDPAPVAAKARRTPVMAAAVGGVVLGLALLVGLATYSGTRGHRHIASRPPTPAAQPIATVAAGHLSVGQTIALGAPAGGVAVGPSGAAWASVPGRETIVRLGPDGRVRSFPGIANGGPITATNGGAWIAQPAGDAIKLTPDGHIDAHVALPGQPVAVAADVDGSSAWVADSSGGIAHVASTGASSPTVAVHVSPAATNLWVGEPNWVWGVNGSLVRVSPDGSGSQTFDAGPGATAVTVDQGVWVAHGDGTVTRFDPQLGHVVATMRTPGALSGIAAREGSPYVWAISSAARSLYEIGLAGPQVVRVVRFSSPPTGVAVTHLGVWVTTAGGSLIRINR